jgi:TolA-binding protein
LSPNDGFVLSRVDGTLSAREIEGMIPLPPEEVRQSLLGLLSTGIVEFQADSRRPREPEPPRPPAEPERPSAEAAPPAVPEPPPAAESASVRTEAPPQAAPPAEEPAPTREGPSDERRLEIEGAWEGRKTMTHFEVLGLERSASGADVKEAYFRLAKRFHPDVHHGENLGDLRDKLEQVFIRLGEAYEVLRDTEKRGEYEAWIGRPKAPAAAGAAVTDGPPAEAPDPEAESRRAEAAVDEATALYEKEKYWDAIQKIEPILETLTDKTRLRAQLVLARCYLKNPKWEKTAKETLEIAVQENPKAAEAYALLGALYKQKGLRTRAASLYRRVLELQPDHKDAAEALAELGPKEGPSHEGGGFLKKIFRRS